jgi:hypothetical protein
MILDTLLLMYWVVPSWQFDNEGCLGLLLIRDFERMPQKLCSVLSIRVPSSRDSAEACSCWQQRGMLLTTESLCTRHLPWFINIAKCFDEVCLFFVCLTRQIDRSSAICAKHGTIYVGWRFRNGPRRSRVSWPTCMHAQLRNYVANVHAGPPDQVKLL